jgi:hypothetical protein
MSKYKNKITTVDNIKFHSQKEAHRYLELKQLRQAKFISDLELQPSFKLSVNDKFICSYRADFSYFDHKIGHVIYEDVKGFKTQVYKLKKKLTEALYNITIHEI